MADSPHRPEDPGADSLDVAELVTTLEREFGIVIPAHEAQAIRTVADAVRCIERHRGGEPPNSEETKP